MALFTSEVEGLTELMKAFAELGDDAMPYVQKAAWEGGSLVLQRAKNKIPIRTGRAHYALKLRKMNVKPGKYYLFHSVTYATRGEDSAPYIAPLEFGHDIKSKGRVTGHVKERPFMRPAADISKDDVVNIVKKHVGTALDKMGGER